MDVYYKAKRLRILCLERRDRRYIRPAPEVRYVSMESKDDTLNTEVYSLENVWINIIPTSARTKRGSHESIRSTTILDLNSYSSQEAKTERIDWQLLFKLIPSRHSTPNRIQARVLLSHSF